MAVLQNKLVWNSIEALHQEALGVLPHASTNDDLIEPVSSSISHEKTRVQQNLQKSSGDVIARIDRLLEKLDEDETKTAEMLASENANHVSYVKSENDIDPETVSIKKEVNETSEISSNISNNVDQDNALADIATAIRDAQQNPDETSLKNKNQDTSMPFDMAFLSTTIANDVRQEVSLMLASEIPNVVRKAVDEGIKDSLANLTDKLEPKTVNKTRTKSRAKQKAQAKKTVKRKTSSNKSAAKKIS